MQELAKEIQSINENGNYYTYEELRYRVKPDAADRVWQMMKLARHLASQRLPFDPIEIRYVLTGEIAEELYLCDQDLSRIFDVGKKTLDAMSAYIIEALSDEAIYSSKLEGAVTTELVAKHMLRKNIPPKTKDEQMIVNNHHAMQLIRDKKDILLTPECLCEIHRIVTTDTLKDEHQSGTFRTTDDVAVVEGRSGKVVHYPPKSAELPALIQAVCDLANRDRKNSPADSFVHPIIVGIALHFLIGYIHPFYDGNGRTARTLFYWYVLSRGYRLFEYIPISKIITQAPTQYRNAYTATEKDAMDLTYFIGYNIHCIQKAREKLAEHLHNERERISKADRLTAALPDLTKRQGQILRYMLEYKDEEFGIREIAERFSIVYQTARTDLMHLEDCKYLRMRKKGKAQYYIVDKEWLASVQGSRV
jgi:Fic family protein